MLAKHTAEYSAPRVTEQRSLHGSMMPEWRSIDPRSDAEIKHGVRPVDNYRAPRITEERSLDGQLQPTKSWIVGR